MSGYAFHPEAFRDLDEIWEFIAEDSIEAAERVIADIFDSIRVLQSLRNYLIAYAPDESPLWVAAVLHDRRSPRVMAAILRGRE